MPSAKFTQSVALSIALASLLTACGGGGGGGDNPAEAPASAEVASNQDAVDNSSSGYAIPEASAAALAAAEMVSVQLSGSGITTNPVLKKANGMPVTSIDDLPEGITNSAWMKKTAGRQLMRVRLSPGTYTLSKPWTWTPAQSGRLDSQLYIEALTPGTVVISGSKRMVVTRAQHAGAARVSISPTLASEAIAEQLWVNDERAVRARSPNIGKFFYVQKAAESWAGQPLIGTIAANRQAFTALSGNLTGLSGLSAAERTAGVLVAMHNWTTSHHRIEEATGNDVRVSPAARWPFLRYGTSQRYFIENIPSALDAEGEWYQNPTTRALSYIPKIAERSTDLVFDVPRQNKLLVLQGDAANNKWVEHINFKGLKFRYAHLPLPAEGLVDQQAAVEVNAAVEMDSARSVTLTDCEISKVGGYAVWLRSNVRYATVAGCEIYDTGAGGIKIGLSKQPNVATATGYNTVRSNRIHSTGFQFPAGVGVWIGQSGNNAVEDNFIGDTTYTAISVGWNWGYGVSLARNNQINRNYLHNIMQGALSDGAGIYTLGVSPGTEIKGNVIKNVKAYNYYGNGAWGIYNDEGSSNILIDSNIVVGTDHGGYMQNYGANITVSNNVFAQGEFAEMQVAKSEYFPQVAFNNNRLIPTLSAFISFGTRAPMPKVSFQGNKISKQLFAGIVPSSDCGSACQVDSKLAIAAGDKYDVPTVTDAGGLVRLPNQVARTWRTAELTTSASASNIWTMGSGFNFDAATAEVGTVPFGMTAVPKERPDLLSVGTGTSGEKFLAFRDSPSITNKWEPYGMVVTDYQTGTTTVSFTIKVDANSEFLHEWRDYRGSPYQVGPSVNFSGSRGIMIKNQVVAPLPVGQWAKVTIVCTQGANPRWTLMIKYADDTFKTISNQPPQDSDWKVTKAFFFISNASALSTTGIGEWSIANQP